MDRPNRLGVRARQRLVESPDVHVSALTSLEFQIKAMLGKFSFPSDLEDRWSDVGVAPLPFTVAHANTLPRFPELARHDPFDRMLLAQASYEELHFLTADAVLLGLGYDWIVDAAA
ncbi:MAG: hypothetical protein L0H31_03450 [Nocardioidaceae bacterium]|nr:hypothetical protein [Nocardioidaceae bacterium]